MNDPAKALQAMLQTGGSTGSSFAPNSRYFDTATANFTKVEGRTIVYLRRRFVPDSSEFSVLQEHGVVQGDRLDNVTARYLGDPEQFWRVCDANGAIRPDELTETIGNKIRITLPQGIAGPKNA
ncbi:MAG: LysM domain-containing protein [Candidatus Binatia bacterium]